ncbi:hypothetical protein DEDE109153_17545 [Deinococcus deserti]
MPMDASSGATSTTSFDVTKWPDNYAFMHISLSSAWSQLRLLHFMS